MEQIDTQLNFLTGGGEAGQLIRSLDWTQTSLGPPQDWPQSLKTCVRIILTSRQPMFVWWGAELINIYNDPYNAIVGGKHPWAMGRPAKEVWREIWEQVAPRVETAMTGNVGTYDESLLLIMERNGYPEETYYTFSYSPVPGNSGMPEGIICANTDDTERIISQRQLRTLKDLGKAFIDSTSDEDIYRETTRILKENPQDFTFGLFYSCSGPDLVLAGQTDPVAEDLAPLTIGPEQVHQPWPLAEAIKSHRHVLMPVADKQLPCGAWEIPTHQVLVLPVVQNNQQQPYGALVIGVNPYRLIDEKYLSFFYLLADQIATGISNVRAYEEERKRVASLVELDKAKTVFFNNVSHEFRTPLTLMLGPLEEMMSLPEEAISPVIKENIQPVYRNTRRLLKLVNSLLEFSRIEAGRIQAAFRPVALAPFTADLASGFRSVIEKAGLSYEVNCQAIQQQTFVDTEMWEKIVLNLLSNAFKYTMQGAIGLSLYEVPGEIILEVRDTGTGIPASELPRMFERFHRVPDAAGRTHEGTGIGLSLIHELIKMHQGSISVESEEGKGSIFKVTIPAGRDHLPGMHVMEAATAGAAGAGSVIAEAFVDEAASLLEDAGAEAAWNAVAAETETVIPDKHTRVLVVDDNADMRSYLARLLHTEYTVFTAGNGKEALDNLSAIDPHLIISDIMMPLVDGQQLVRTIRSDVNRQRLPVILLSARAGDEARVEGLEAGADDYLVKPFSAKELLAKVRSQVNIAKARNHAEDLLKRLFIHAPMAITILLGPEFMIDLANEQILDLWNKQQEEVIGKPLLAALPELKDQGFEELLQEVYQTGSRYVSEEREMILRRQGRLEQVFVKFIYEPLREADGSVSGVILLAHEITDLVLARSQAQANEEEMRKLIRQKDEFLSIASHELKTPLTSMSAIIQILEREEMTDQTIAGFINKAARQMDRLTVLVSDLLDVSSIQAGKMKFYPERFRLKDMLADVIEQHQQSQASHKILCGDNPDIEIEGDRNRLEQVLNNLLSNAVKYSPEADEVIVHTAVQDKKIRISVKDKGIGIPQDMMPMLFERFFRVEHSGRTFSGLGLGLYISREIIQRHGGAIGVEHNKDKGSVFWFELPA